VINLFQKIQRLQTEDYFTEILVFILQKDDKLVKKFLEMFGYKKKFRQVEIESQYIDCKTGKRPDIHISLDNGNTTIFIENKIDASINEKIVINESNEEIIENQLVKYSEILKRKIKDEEDKTSHGFVFLLTRDYEHIKGATLNNILKNTQNELKIIYWEDVYSFFSSYEPNDEILKFMINQFIGLMESENMEPYKKFNQKDFEELSKHMSNLIKLMNKVRDELEKRGYKFNSIKLNSDNYIETYSGKTKLSFAYNIEESEIIFYIYKDLNNEQIHQVEENGYAVEKGCCPQICYDCSRFFKKDISNKSQVQYLLKFCINQINLCKKLKIIK